MVSLGEVDRIDSRIADLQAQLRSLAEERSVVEKSLNNYRTILSPIRRLPNDILDEIFYRCLGTHRNPITSPREAPILLTHVCQRWRIAVLSSPRLWSAIHVTFSNAYLSKSSIESITGMHVPQENVGDLESYASRVLKNRCEVVKEWLDRAANCPLSISMSYASGARTQEELALRHGDLTHELFTILISHRNHWRTLELVMPMEIYLQLEAMISSLDDLSSLTALRVELEYRLANRSYLAPGKGPAPIHIFNAPSLRRVSLSGPGISGQWWSMPPPFSNQGERLRYFCSHSPLKVTQIYSLLKGCCNLTSCKTLLMCLQRQAMDLNQTFKEISLPYLSVFAIIEQADEVTYPVLTRFYESINAPLIRSLSYRKGGVHTPSEGIDPPIIALLQRTSILCKLTLDPMDCREEFYRSVFQIVSPTLKHLVLCRGSWNPPWAPWYRPPTESGFSLQLLLTNEGRAQSSDTGSQNSCTLLPLLEVFEWSPAAASDETVLQFINERIDPVSERGLVALKTIRLTFDRPVSKDILSEIKRYEEQTARTCGGLQSNIVIDLNYSKDSSQRVLDLKSRLSSYRLEDDRTWRHDDLDEPTNP